ncbi:MAG: CTP synthase [Marivirga sp.]|nr:CTP synthase [Marivirga sp.]
MLMKRISIGLVGDFDEKMYTHSALNNAIEHCRAVLDFQVDPSWIPTQTIDQTVFNENKFQGFWIVPGSPYVDDSAVYNLIRWAREHDFPLLGSCGGFQYMIIEYTRNVLGLSGASHEETNPDANQQVITKLSCSLKGRQEDVFIPDQDSWLYQTLKTDKLLGHFYCSYGVNPDYQKVLNNFPFVFTAFSSDGEARAFELKDHRFFKGTLFQPSLDSTRENPNPLIMDFFRTCKG